MNRKKFIRSLAIFSIIIALVLIGVSHFIFQAEYLYSLIITVLFSIVLLIVFFSIDAIEIDNSRNIEQNFNVSSRQALNYCSIGLLMYSDEYEITWMSEFFMKKDLDHIGEKLLNWIPELQDILQGEVNQQIITYNEETFMIYKLVNSSTLVFKDISKQYYYENKLNDDSYVLGMLSYDNYDEYQESEDIITFVNTNIKTPVIEYFKNFNILYKTLKNNKLLLVLNEAQYKQIRDDRFSILTKIRKVSMEANLDVTLSMAFARGSDNFKELDDSLQSLFELAQTRGGDQVVVRKIGEDTLFFGGTTEASEKQNKTKVRVMINSIKDLIINANNVIIVGHKDMDADCLGSALCMSNIVMNLNKPVYVVSKSGGIETMINDVLHKYSDTIYRKHNLVSEDEAMNYLDENSLVIMVDHHSLDQSNGSSILKQANQVIIIDHHRRKADLEVTPLMYYIEASASSTCELTCEFLPYMSRKLEITPEEANIMYIGLMIDTDRFRVRTGARTFDVAKQLRRYGADPTVCDELIQEPYEMVMKRADIISESKQYKKGILVSALNSNEYSRSIASQACDQMIKGKDIEAAFVICSVNNQEVIISARSKGNVNVQTILEKMNGGGHMSAAGLQRKDTTVAKLENELLKVLDEYFMGEKENESNTAI